MHIAVNDPLAVYVSGKDRLAERPGHFAVPAGGAANMRRDFFRSAWSQFFDGLNEIAKGFEFGTLDVQIENGIAVTHHAAGANVIAGSIKFGRLKGENFRVLLVGKFPVGGDRDVICGDFIRCGPTGLTGNRKMIEGAFPCFDRVRGHHRVPMQAINWKTAMINGRKKLSDADTFHASLRAEIEVGEGHGDAALHGAAKREGREIADVDAVFVELVSTGTAQSALAENIVIQDNFSPGICSGTF